MKLKILLLGIVASLSSFMMPQALNKGTADASSKYTTAGNIGLTITNYGMHGSGWINWGKGQPSCEYPKGSRIEHLFGGSLWIGGRKTDIKTNTRGDIRVSTAVMYYGASAGDVEFTNFYGSVSERSSVTDSSLYDCKAVSHQDFITDFVDTNRYDLNQTLINNGKHFPLGVSVHEESYAWNYSFANNFVILNYQIKNVDPASYLDSVYVGLWSDMVVRNTFVSPAGTGGSSFYDKTAMGFIDSTYFDTTSQSFKPYAKAMYAYDAKWADGAGATDSYIAAQYLGSYTKYHTECQVSGTPTGVIIDKQVDDYVDKANFTFWGYNTSPSASDDLFRPDEDIYKYGKLMGFFDKAQSKRLPDILLAAQSFEDYNPHIAKNRAQLISTGPITRIAPGETVNLVFVLMCAKKEGTDSPDKDTKEQKKNLYNSIEWALRAYNGNDRNRDGKISSDENIFGDSLIHRFILPTPPDAPKVKVVPSDRKVTVYWNKKSEDSRDAITGEKDFEGYKLYRTNAGYEFGPKIDPVGSLVEIGSFDFANDSIGYNTGFDKIRLAKPVIIERDTFYYHFDVPNLLNGWQYAYSVTAFDKGDKIFNINSLESSPNVSIVIPGTTANEDKEVKIGVYPNPYYGTAVWDGKSERLRKIYFYNLPKECELYIYTLAGDIVKKIKHDGNSNGSDLRWFQSYAKEGKQVMAGGEHAWDLITENDQAVATGMYLFTVKNMQTGDIKTGKFLVIK